MSDDPLASAALAGDPVALTRAARALGPAFWDQSSWWNTTALMVAFGHSDEIVSFYDRDRPPGGTLVDGHDSIAVPEIIAALRKSGRNGDAGKLLALFKDHLQRLPNAGRLADEKSFGLTAVAALSGDGDAAIRGLDYWTKRHPIDMTHIPAMALRYDPIFGALANDPRFPAIEDRVRVAVNRERAKLGLPLLSREAWISDPKTLLTKN